MENTVAIVQARMTSTRLPGKVMRSVLGRPFLGYFMERVQRALNLDEVVVATTVNEDDEPIVVFCKENKIRCIRGPEHDVLERYRMATEAVNAKTLVRLTADCPLIDPAVIDQVVEYYHEHSEFDFVTNSPTSEKNRTYPHGMDVEVFSKTTLERAAREAKLPEEREHVTVYIRRHPEIFTYAQVDYSFDISDYRLTLDTVEDYAFLTRVLAEIYPIRPRFTLEDVLQVINAHSEWRDINRDVEQRIIV